MVSLGYFSAYTFAAAFVAAVTFIPRFTEDYIEKKHKCTAGNKNVGEIENRKIHETQFDIIHNISVANTVNEIAQTARHNHNKANRLKSALFAVGYAVNNNGEE
jgi:hypothetical protein